MGKMKMNPDRFALPAVNSKSAVIVDDGKIIAEEVYQNLNACNDNKIIQYGNQNEGYDINIRADVIGNIIGDICGVLKETAKAISTIQVEKEKTKQVQAFAKTKIKESKEQTKRIDIQESAETERTKMRCIEEIKKAEIELEKELAYINKEKEKIASDERKFQHLLEMTTLEVKHIISINEKLMESSSYSDEIHKNNEQLIYLAGKIVDSYIAATNK